MRPRARRSPFPLPWQRSKQPYAVLAPQLYVVSRTVLLPRAPPRRWGYACTPNSGAAVSSTPLSGAARAAAARGWGGCLQPLALFSQARAVRARGRRLRRQPLVLCAQRVRLALRRRGGSPHGARRRGEPGGLWLGGGNIPENINGNIPET